MKQLLTKDEYELYKKAIINDGDDNDVINFVKAVGREKAINAIKNGAVSMYKQQIKWTEEMRINYFLKIIGKDSIAKIPSSSIITFVDDGKYSACTIGKLMIAEIKEIVSSGRLVNYYDFNDGINLFGRDVE